MYYIFKYVSVCKNIQYVYSHVDVDCRGMACYNMYGLGVLSRFY